MRMPIKELQESIKELESKRGRLFDSIQRRIILSLLILGGLSVTILIVIAFRALNSTSNIKEISKILNSIELLLIGEDWILISIAIILLYFVLIELIPWLLRKIKYSKYYIKKYYPAKIDYELQNGYLSEKHTKQETTTKILVVIYLVFIEAVIIISALEMNIDWRILFTIFALGISVNSAVDAFRKARYIEK